MFDVELDHRYASKGRYMLKCKLSTMDNWCILGYVYESYSSSKNNRLAFELYQRLKVVLIPCQYISLYYRVQANHFIITAFLIPLWVLLSVAGHASLTFLVLQTFRI